MPVGPYGAQSRLQHDPPHAGMPPSPVISVPHTVPSTVEQFDDPLAGCEQVPRIAPAAMLQMPPQQSVPSAHTSPFCPQYDAEAHRPWLHRVEQQLASVVHALPSVLQDELSGAQVPPVHVPLQQLAPVV